MTSWPVTRSPSICRRRSACPQARRRTDWCSSSPDSDSRVEGDARRRERWNVVDDRIDHSRFGRLGNARLAPSRDDAPAVVAPALDDVDLVAGVGAVLRLPQSPRLRVPGQALRVAVSVAPDRRHRIRPGDEWIVARHRSIVVDTVNLPIGFERSCACRITPRSPIEKKRCPSRSKMNRDPKCVVGGVEPRRRKMTC